MLEKRIEDLRCRTEKLLDKILRIDGDLTEEYQKQVKLNGKSKNFYEGRILVNMAASVMRQDDLKPLHGNLDWEKLFRVADYNKISNPDLSCNPWK